MSREVLHPDPDTLASLNDGSIRLHVPLLDEVIQVNAEAINGKTCIRVDVSGQNIDVRREDERPIEVDVRQPVFDEDKPWDEGLQKIRVFELPVQAIALARFSLHSGGWVFGPEVPPCNKSAAEFFLSVLGEYAIPKQQELYRSSRSQ